MRLGWQKLRLTSAKAHAAWRSSWASRTPADSTFGASGGSPYQTHHGETFVSAGVGETCSTNFQSASRHRVPPFVARPSVGVWACVCMSVCLCAFVPVCLCVCVHLRAHSSSCAPAAFAIQCPPRPHPPHPIPLLCSMAALLATT